MTNYINAIRSNIGGRKEQQDFSGSANAKFGLITVVCDGMGGAKGGATASRMAVEIVLAEFTTTTLNSAALALAGAIQKANTEIYYRSRNDENCKGMGSTITAIVLQDEKATIAHVGDSRIYQLRKAQLLSGKPEIIYRTSDHSKVFELVRRGIMSEEQARVSDESNIILKALGIKPNIEIELKDDLPYLKKDWFMLCTDGVWSAVPENRLLDMLSVKGDAQVVLDSLINRIDRIGNKNGGNHDNLTAAIIECRKNSSLKAPMNMQSKIIIVVLAVLFGLSLGYLGFSSFQFSNLKQKIESDSIRYERKYNSLSAEKNNIQKTLDSLKKVNSRLKADNGKAAHLKTTTNTNPASGSINLNAPKDVKKSLDDEKRNLKKGGKPVPPETPQKSGKQSEDEGVITTK